jgi:microcystin-dependent protein
MGTPYMGEIKIISWNFAPQGWAFANGQFLPINQNQALFSLLGTQYGGNGQTTFALPDLRGKVPIHQGSGFTLGQAGGENAHTLILGELPAHTHFLRADATTVATSNSATAATNGSLGQTIGAPATGASFSVSLYTANVGGLTTQAPQEISNVGGSQPHENRQPFLTLNMIIALQGVFPSQN